MRKRFYLGIDQGTTLTTAVVCGEDLSVLGRMSVAHTTVYPHPGWAEQDPEELYANCLLAAGGACAAAGIAPSDIQAVGLDHQGESCLIWEKKSGRPVCPMITWQDRRTAGQAEALRREKGREICSVSGMQPDAYYSATKLAWILDHTENGRKRLAEGELMPGTFNTYFAWRASGGRVYATEPGSAGCMMLMNLRKTDWDDSLLSLFGFRREQMPRIVDTDEVLGETDPACFGGIQAKLACITDSPAGIIGGGCVGEGILKTSYGTGSFMLLQTGTRPVFHESLTGDCMWRMRGKPWYALRGACYTAGTAIEWLKNNLGLIREAAETESICRSTPDTGGVQFVPAFSGLAAPYWDQYARGLFIGLTAGTTRAQLVRAVVESLAYQVADCFETMKEAGGIVCLKMRADGGASANAFLMQLQADMLGIPVEVPEEKETAALGSAVLAGIADGSLPGPEAVNGRVRIRRIYEPRMKDTERKDRLTRWREAAVRSIGWEKE